MPSEERIEFVLTQTTTPSGAFLLAATSPTVRAWTERSVVMFSRLAASKRVASLASSEVTDCWSIGATATFG